MKHRPVTTILAACALQLQCRAPDDRALGGEGAECGPPAICASADAGENVEAAADASGRTSSNETEPPSDATDRSADSPADAGVDGQVATRSADGASDAPEACASNACGGCAVLGALPGTPCGQCGMYVCAAEGESVACQDPAYRSVKTISAGYDHTCVLTTESGIRCWGNNTYGQMGDGTTTNRSAPANTDVLTGVQVLASGGQHVCALMIAGGVKCWGDNESGQLGDGTTMTRTVPVDVLTPSGPLTGVRTIAAGYQHTCAIMMTGGLRCWGRNVEGQLGDGTTNARYSPSNSDAVPGVQAIAMGIYHTCAITAAGTQCWGYNMSGQVGDGTMTNRTAPTTVMTASVALGAAQAVGAGGYHSCAIMPTTRGVRCWGLNGLGQLGDGTTVDHEVAPDIDGLGGVSALAAGGYHTCALTTAGGVRCWGLNADGELGDGTTSNRSTAPNTDTLSGVLAITAGNSHGCALTATGVRCWGLNAHGQIGDGTTTNRLTPGPEVAICP